MPTPLRVPQIAAAPAPHHDDAASWRCHSCEKLLGVHRDGRLHIKFARGADYFVAYPVIATCRACNTANYTSDPAR